MKKLVLYTILLAIPFYSSCSRISFGPPSIDPTILESRVEKISSSQDSLKTKLDLPYYIEF